MLTSIIVAFVLLAATVLLHAIGLSLVMWFLVKSQAIPLTRHWPITWLLIRMTWMLVLMHVAEITVWALFYKQAGCMPDVRSALYFSGTTYTTIGYGDLVLPGPWRLLGPVEGLAGVLMCALSGGFFFAVLNRIYVSRLEVKRK